jgi:hypothetical protein
MRSLAASLSSKLPTLGLQRFLDDPFIHVKFWIPEVNWTWYVIEGEPSRQGFRFYGYVIGLDEEWEEFSLQDLEVVRGPDGQRVRRDDDFVPGLWSEVNAARTDRKE